MICYLFSEPKYFIFTSGVPVLLYYAYIPITLIAFFVGLFIFLKDRKSLLNQLIFLIFTTFSLWTISALIEWTNIHSNLILLLWNFSGLLLSLIAIFSIYFIYVFLEKRDISTKVKVVFITLLTPVLLITPTVFNLSGVDITTCDAFKFEGLPFKFYYILLGVLAMIWIFVLLIRQYRTAASDFRKQIVLMGTGIESFLFLFFVWVFVADFLTEVGILPDSQIEMYGVIGVAIFMIYMGFLIVRFKTFDIKTFGAQVLVLALIALIGSQFFYENDLPSIIVTSVTLVVTGVIGINLMRSVKKEIEAKEELGIANKKQENLIHVMNHQIKGFFTVAKNIFAELSEGETYGKMSEEVQPLLLKGMQEMNDGVDYVQSILRGESAHSGTLPFDMKPMNLRPVIENLISKQKEVAEKHGLSFESNIADGNYNIVGDTIQLDEAFKNLFTNAIKYNNPNGSIKVTLSNKDNKILFAIKDTGRGISKEDQQNLFKPGGMGKDSMKYNTDAAGYGLAFVKPVIETHKDGKIWYETEVGKGTTFFVELPIVQTSK